ncbi:retrovirus-related pol polyprotein from transposon TNT 1-94 [Tanacetum coccineum]
MTGAKFDNENSMELVNEQGSEERFTGRRLQRGFGCKLDDFVHKKSLANKLYLKKKLYTFYMPVGQKIFEHIDEFNKIVLDLANIEVKFEDKAYCFIINTSLQHPYEHFVDTCLYGQEAFNFEDVKATLNSKENKERSKVEGDDGEGLYVRGRTDRRDSRQSRGKSRSKSQGVRLKCYICHSEDHLKRNCMKNNRKKSTSYVEENENSKHQRFRLMNDVRVMTVNDASVLLGDNRECKIKGIGKVRVQLRDGSSFVLNNVRYIPELKRNLISLGTLEKDGYTIKMQSSRSMAGLMLVMKKKTSKRRKIKIDHEDGVDEDAGDQETDQPPDLTDYQLTQDREPRTIIKPLRKNKTWEIVDPLAGQKLVSSKWLFKEFKILRYKARLAARGFTQRAGIDYNEVFSSVVRHTSIQVILALTACKDYELE